ncbi:alpha/beta fold hydrolase [Phaeovulum sp.]|uniref:alpha/beta fold hydrolase n=1 Tax=Phaeovulum sp. TaxID=2934796 RepID=UPI0039E3EE88
MLNTMVHGVPGTQPPLVIVPGLFGSARNWGIIARRLSDDRQVIAVDMRNHGDSPWDDAHGYDDLAHDLLHLIDEYGGKADVMGHSMGGKAAMQLALTHGDRLNRLIVADIAPVAYDHSMTHLVDAMQGLDLTGVTLRSEADRRLAGEIADDGVRAFLLQSLDLKSTPPRWKLNLDVLRAEMDRITGWPDTPGHFDGPVLFVSGALSDYIRPEYHAAIKAQFPAAEFTRIEGAGHWLHAEQPREFEAVLHGFLSPTGVSSAS